MYNRHFNCGYWQKPSLAQYQRNIPFCCRQSPLKEGDSLGNKLYISTWLAVVQIWWAAWRRGKLEAHGLSKGRQHHSVLSPFRKTCLGRFLMASGKSVVTICFHLSGNCLSLIALFCPWAKTLSWQQNTGSHIQFSIYGMAIPVYPQEFNCSQRPYLKYFPSDLVTLRITDVFALRFLIIRQKEAIKENDMIIFSFVINQFIWILWRA